MGTGLLFQKGLTPHRDPEKHTPSTRSDSHGPWVKSWQKHGQGVPEMEKGPIMLWAHYGEADPCPGQSIPAERLLQQQKEHGAARSKRQ